MSLLLAAKVVAQRARDKVYAFGSSAWEWATDVLGSNKPDAAAARRFAPYGSLLWESLKATGRYVGAGAAMLGISTERGRQVLEFVTRPFRKVGTFLLGLWNKTLGSLYVDNPTTVIDKARNWTADRMATVDEFVSGVVIKAAVAAGPHLELDSNAMKATRVAGTALAVMPFTMKVQAGVTAGAVGGPFATLAFVAGIGVAGVALLGFLARTDKGKRAITTTMNSGQDTLAGVNVKVQAEKTSEAAQTVASETVKKSAPAGNRQQRRAQQRSKAGSAKVHV